MTGRKKKKSTTEYEYDFFFIFLGGVPKDEGEMEIAKNRLNELGKDRWELVEFVVPGLGVFKRSI